MASPMIARRIDDLKDVLIRERDLLREGYPVATIALVKEKTEIMMDLGPLIDAWERGEVANDEIDQLKEISSLAQQNATRLNAIKNGMSSLLQRLAEQSDQTHIGAYDQSGNQMRFQRGSGVYKKSV